MPGSSNDLASLIEDADHDKPAVLALSEEALNEAFRPGYKPLCHVEVCKLADIARSALRLPPSVPPTEVRILNAGSFDKVFIIRFYSIATVARVPFDVPAARDPIRLRSQIATLDFLKTHKPTIPLPRVLTAVADSDDPLRAPYVVSEFCRGTPLTIQEWYVDMSDASRDAAIELLADNWVKIVTPISFQSMGSIVRDPARPSGFRVMPMISQFPGQATPLLDPSVAMLDGHKSLGDYWTLTMEGHRRQIVDFWPDNDHSVVVLDLRYEKYTLGHLWQCYEAILELVHIAASLDPLADAPAMALMHADYFFWKNILFSADRTRIEGIIDWDDAVVVPRDLVAVYPYELTDQAGVWRTDPPDVFAIPPGTLFEDEGLWETAVQETQQRRTFREVVREQDPQLAELYTDCRARFRRRVHLLVSQRLGEWLYIKDWVLGEGLEEARALRDDEK